MNKSEFEEVCCVYCDRRIILNFLHRPVVIVQYQYRENEKNAENFDAAIIARPEHERRKERTNKAAKLD